MKKLFAVALAVLVFAVPAVASAEITVLDPQGPATGETVAEALEVGADQITGVSVPEYAYDEFETDLHPLGVGRTSGPAPGSLTGFPTNGDSYAIISSGDVETIATELVNLEEGTTTAFEDQLEAPPLDRGPAAEDWTVLKVDVEVPDATNCLALDYRFLSEEFPEYVGSPFNDAFIAELAVTSWRVESDGSLARSGDFAASPAGTAISVNGVGPTSVAPGEAAGTYFDAATGLITTKTPISPGEHSVYLSVFDASDDILDSAVFLDNLRFISEDPSTCRPPTGVELAVPPPGAPPAPPSNEFSTGPKVKFNSGGTKVTFTVNVPGPGVLTAGSPPVARASAAGDGASISKKKKSKKLKKPRKLVVPAKVRAKAAGPVKITVRLTGPAKRYLAKKRKLKVPIRLTFTPDGGVAASETRTVTFKKRSQKCGKKATGKAAKKCGKGRRK